MARITQRLSRLERGARELGAGRCPLCDGHPMAVLYDMHEPDPNGPGYRRTGECYLVTDYGSNLTDDLHCTACGAEAAQMRVIRNVRTGPVPTGRRVCLV